MTAPQLQVTASASLIALILLCVLWESLLAPIRPHGTLLTLKVLPLLASLTGILRGRVYTYQWASMLVLVYFAEGVMRAWADHGLSRWLAAAEIALSVIFFITALAYVRAIARARNT